MKLESQCCSLELAKELKELGVEQESFFRHMSGTIMCRYEQRQYPTAWDSGISAFTVAELGEMLPWDIVIARNDDKKWLVTFQANGLPESKSATFISDTEADARALMLIHLIKNDLYTPLNKNL